MEEVNLKQFLIEIGIRQEAAELIDMAFPTMHTKRLFQRSVMNLIVRGMQRREAVAQTWKELWTIRKKQGIHAGPKPTQAYIDML